MARIRTIKPEFFSSDDVVALSPWARLLYIALWCEADRRGRLEWKPTTFKRRYFADDAMDIRAACDELVAQGLVQLYAGGELAYIPRFEAHQHINPRESESRLLDPLAPGSDLEDCRRPGNRCNKNDASPRVSDAQGGREGKGRDIPTPNGVGVIGVTEPVTPSSAAGPADAAIGADAPPPAPPPQVVPMVAPCPVDQVVALYHELLPELPQVRVFSVKRRQALHGRWRWILQSRKPGGERRATNAAEALDWLRRFFERARDNDFVMGRAGRGRGHEGWRADLDYLLSDRGLQQVLERTDPAGGGLCVPGAAPGVMAG